MTYLWRMVEFCGLWKLNKSVRNSLPEVFLRKGILEIYSKFLGEHPYRSAILIKLLCNFFEVTFWHGCFPVNLLHIFVAPFYKSTSGELLVKRPLWVKFDGIKKTNSFKTFLFFIIYCFKYSFLDLPLDTEIPCFTTTQLGYYPCIPKSLARGSKSKPTWPD